MKQGKEDYDAYHKQHINYGKSYDHKNIRRLRYLFNTNEKYTDIFQTD